MGRDDSDRKTIEVFEGASMGPVPPDDHELMETTVMHALLISIALFGQTKIDPPAPASSPALLPAPAPVEATSTEEPLDTMEKMKDWLLVRFMIDLSFDTQKSAEVEKMLDRMSEQQLRLLVAAYKERKTKQDEAAKLKSEATEQQTLDNAKLNLQQAEAYRNFLSKEYDRRLQSGQITQNFLYQSALNNQRLAYLYNSPFSYAPWGYGGIGYGYTNYGAFAYGAPGFGSPMIYGSPYYGFGFGYR